MKQYKITGLLGNVLSAFTDNKLAVNSGGMVSGYLAQISSSSDYYPFGSLQPGRNFNAGDYRFGFNGKENDNEVKGTGNSVDFGARIYDPRLGRWMSIDPLQQKYPNQSPYTFCGNNPVLFVDFDGRDYGVTVEHTETGGTITIKATFYTAKGNTESHNSALHAAQYWKDQSGKYQYKVGEGKDALYYDVKFELNVVEVDNPTEEFERDRKFQYQLKTDETQLTPDWTSNTYEVLPDNDKKFIDPKNPQNTVNGVTSNGNQVAVSESNKDGDTGPHELGHALGFKHMFGSLMSESMNNGRTGDINKTIISIMLSNVKIGPSPVDNIFKGPGNGVRKSDVGTAPANFNDGKVIKKPPK